MPGLKRHPICLALQGGGSHGAFQWGVLDRLLEADILDIRAVTAASAGAMNAAALITGLEQDGARGGRAALDKLWREVNQSGGRNVFGDSEKFRLAELRASAGVGLSWISPIGPLRLAVAHPLRKFPGDRIQKLQFQIGTSF